VNRATAIARKLRHPRAAGRAVKKRAFPWLIGAPDKDGPPLERLGSSYGGWWVPSEIIHPGTIAYCIGAGEDITFDLELLARGCTVRVADPTPRAVAHVEGLDIRSDRFAFLPTALWTESGSIRMFAPRNPAHVSHSATNLQGTSTFIDVPAQDLSGLRHAFGDDRIDFLKIDIEGAEVPVLLAFTATDGALPGYLAVEFDQPQTVRTSRAIVAHLKTLGYRLVRTEGFNVLFGRQDHERQTTTRRSAR
jgi:FkbM family methyltransferase